MPLDQVTKQARRAGRRLVGRTAKDPAGWRAQALQIDREITAKLMQPAPPGVTVEDRQVPVPGRGHVRVRLYLPQTPPPHDAAPAGPNAAPAPGSGGKAPSGAVGDHAAGGPNAATPPGSAGKGPNGAVWDQGAQTPGPTPAGGAGAGRRGAILAFFGGAFRQGGVDHPSVDIFNRTRAHDAGIIVAAVDYALAPEHTYPEALEQGYAALEWLGGGADGIGLRVDRLGIEGQSSGANLAAGVALMSRDRGGPALAFQLLEVPTLDLTGGHLSRADAWKIGAPPFLVARGLRALVRDYLGDSSLATQPYASPLLAPDLSGLPPAHIAIAEYDLLRGDGEAYAARLAAAGIEVKLEQFARLGHESLLYTAALEPARRWQADVTELLRTLRSDT